MNVNRTSMALKLAGAAALLAVLMITAILLLSEPKAPVAASIPKIDLAEPPMQQMCNTDSKIDLAEAITLQMCKRPLASETPDNGHVFVRVPAGTYSLGEKEHRRNPRHAVKLKAFEIATTETTNAQFARFVKATGYVTDAEKNGEAPSFHEGMMDWEWTPTKGAYWRFPFGPERPGIEDKMDHPVTQISATDAEAYCRWAGVRLPMLDEWEAAARAGSDTLYPWGDEKMPKGKPMANFWQGKTHAKNTMEDGFLYTAPVGSFPPNKWGLYDVVGNVFEYCTSDPMPAWVHSKNACVGRGGSWWCSSGTCSFFNLVDIGQMNRKASFPNQGFRVARDAKK